MKPPVRVIAGFGVPSSSEGYGVEMLEGIEAPVYSDEHLALRFAEERGADSRYVAAWSKWYRLAGHKWAADNTLLTFNDARAVGRTMSLGCQNPKTADGLASARTAANVERLARADRQLAATVDQWDAKPLLLNTPACVHDLAIWDERPARPSDYFTKSTAVAAAKQGSECPIWKQFLATVTGGDDDLVRFLQRMCGYFLTGEVSAHALFFAYGTGANGKGVFTNTVAGVLGDYATSTPIETFMSSPEDRHPTELADLRGARLVIATETEEGRRWAEARVKQLTGGDPIKARFMRQDFFEFRPQFKLFISGNHKPALRGVDEAIRRRFHLIPFSVTIPKAHRDPDLSKKLEGEWPAILRWMLEGYAMFADQGLDPPQAVTQATAEYLDGEDAFALWFEDCCDREGEAFESQADLFASWKAWASRSGEYVGSTKRFTQTMIAHGFGYSRTSQARGFRGLRLRRSDLLGDAPE